MNKELIIRSSEDSVDFALLKDGKLIELHKEKEEKNNSFLVGDIFIAKIRKPVAGLNAAFVNVGYEKDAFLHYHDLGPNLASYLKFIKLVSAGKIKDFSLKNFQFEKEIDKDGTITDILSANQSVLVQVVKNSKGDIADGGKYHFLKLNENTVIIEKKEQEKTEDKVYTEEEIIFGVRKMLSSENIKFHYVREELPKFLEEAKKEIISFKTNLKNKTT